MAKKKNKKNNCEKSSKQTKTVEKKKIIYNIPQPLYKRNYFKYFIISICYIIFILLLISVLLKWSADSLLSLKETITKLDKVIIVALITGLFTIVTEFISKIITRRQEKKVFLLQKREVAYKQLINLYFLIQEYLQKNGVISSDIIFENAKNFQNDLLLWGSTRVINTWCNFCKHINDKENILINIERVIFSIRKEISIINLEKGQLFFIGKAGAKNEKK